MRRKHCDCGHELAAHEHFRSGTECALCPAGECLEYNGPTRRRWLTIRNLVGRGGERRVVRPVDDDRDYGTGGSTAVFGVG